MNPGGEAPVSEADHCQHTRLRLKLHYLCGFGSRLLCSSKGLNLQNIKHTTLQKNLEEYKGKKKKTQNKNCIHPFPGRLDQRNLAPGWSCLREPLVSAAWIMLMPAIVMVNVNWGNPLLHYSPHRSLWIQQTRLRKTDLVTLCQLYDIPEMLIFKH